MTPRVLIVFNQPVLANDHPDYESEAEVLYSVKIVRESLDLLKIPHDEFGVTSDLAALLSRLQANDFDIVFNLFEGNADRSITEVYFAGLLEWLELPMTGNPTATLALARDKVRAKQLFAGAGVRTPRFQIVSAKSVIENRLNIWPVIVKPADEDASVGIDQGSVVETEAALVERVRYLLDNYGGSVLIEEYISGRELQLSVLEKSIDAPPVVLPPSEIAFKPPAKDGKQSYWPIYTYTAKWDEHSDEFKRAPVVVGPKLEPNVLQQLNEISLRAFEVLGCRDYARIDTRVSSTGEVYVLELNPNPSITSVMIDEGLPVIGLTYDEFIGTLVRNAWQRGQLRKAKRRRPST